MIQTLTTNEQHGAIYNFIKNMPCNLSIIDNPDKVFNIKFHAAGAPALMMIYKDYGIVCIYTQYNKDGSKWMARQFNDVSENDMNEFIRLSKK